MKDKLVVIENIKRLSKLHKIQISDVEKHAGVSIGYFARLHADIVAFRNGNQGKMTNERPLPSIEIFAKISDYLSVSLDLIIDVDLSGSDDAELSLAIFLEQLRISTVNNDLIWQSENIAKILYYDALNANEMHPLVRMNNDFKYDYYDFVQGAPERAYYSFFNCDTAYVMEMYKLHYKERTLFLSLIMQKIQGENLNFYELYSLENGKIVKLARSFTDLDDEFNSVTEYYLSSLFDSVTKNANINPEGGDIRKTMNEYMDYFNFKK